MGMEVETMEVYIVTSGEYSDYGINCVFSTEKDAQAYCDVMNIDNTYGRYRVEQYTIDEPKDTDMARRGRTFYWVTIEGNEYNREGYSYARKIPMIPEDEKLNTDKLSDNGRFTTYVDATDDEHAIKIAQERLMQHKARLAGIS